MAKNFFLKKQIRHFAFLLLLAATFVAAIVSTVDAGLNDTKNALFIKISNILYDPPAPATDAGVVTDFEKGKIKGSLKRDQ